MRLELKILRFWLENTIKVVKVTSYNDVDIASKIGLEIKLTVFWNPQYIFYEIGYVNDIQLPINLVITLLLLKPSAKLNENGEK